MSDYCALVGTIAGHTTTWDVTDEQVCGLAELIINSGFRLEEN